MAKKSKNAKSKTAPQVKTVVAAKGTVTKGAKVPSVSYRTDGACVVSHMEYVADIAAATTVDVATFTFAVNPQRPSVFPWLTAMATRFEMYRFRKLKFMYKPSSSTSHNGWVALGFDFDFYDSAPAKNALLVWKYSAKSALWETAAVDVTGDSRIATYRYCNYDPSSGDARLDMLGNLFVLVQADVTTPVGELFVSYEVEFRQPAFKIPTAIYGRVIQTAPSNSAQIYQNGAKVVGNILAAYTGGANLNEITIYDAGKYLIEYIQQGTGQTTDPFISFLQPSGSSQSLFNSSIIKSALETTTNTSMISALLELLVAPVIMRVGNTTGDNGAQTANLRIATFDTSLL